MSSYASQPQLRAINWLKHWVYSLSRGSISPGLMLHTVAWCSSAEKTDIRLRQLRSCTLISQPCCACMKGHLIPINSHASISEANKLLLWFSELPGAFPCWTCSTLQPVMVINEKYSLPFPCYWLSLLRDSVYYTLLRGKNRDRSLNFIILGWICRLMKGWNWKKLLILLKNKIK